jgi:hypothetical protein
MATQKEMLNALLEQMKAPTEDVQNITGIIYGDNGGGKTVLAVKLAQAILKWKGGGEILFLDAVNAWRSLKNHPELQPNLKRIPYSGKTQLDTIISAIESRPAGFENFKVIILDEASSMTDKDGDTVLAARAAKDPGKDPDVLTQPDMGATTERMRRSVIKLLRQDISVIFVAHQREDEDKSVGYKRIRPRFMPKFSGTIREGLDFVGHMTASPSQNSNGELAYQRFIQVHPSRAVIAKTRVGGLKLKETPDDFVAGVIRWLNNEVGDSNVVTVINDVEPDVAEETASDFAGVVISD